VYECQFQVGYQGLIDLAKRSGVIEDISAKIVYENDYFDYSFGTERKIIHKPLLFGNRGKVIGAYAVWYFKDGKTHPEIMTLEEIYKRREVSQSYQRALLNPDDKQAQKCPWIMWPEEMIIKTVIRVSSKQVPASIDFQQAIELDQTDNSQRIEMQASSTGEFFHGIDATDSQDQGQAIGQDQESSQGSKPQESSQGSSQDQQPGQTMDDDQNARELAIKTFDTVINRKYGKNAGLLSQVLSMISHNAEARKVDLNEFKANIIKNGLIDQFLAHCDEGLRVRNDEKGQEQASSQQEHQEQEQEQEYQEQIDQQEQEYQQAKGLKTDHPLHVGNYIKLKKGNYAKGSGLKAYVEKHHAKIGDMSMDEYSQLDEKYQRVYGSALPYDPDGEFILRGSKPQESSQGSSQDDQQGQDEGSSQDDQQGQDEESSQDEKQVPYPQAEENIDGDEVNVEYGNYARLLELKNQYPQETAQVVGDADLDLLNDGQMAMAIKKIEEIVRIMQGMDFSG
jgi:recombinational DNA repair protein RecT